MLRLIVLLTAVVCCNACRLDVEQPQDTTNSLKGCSDSDGNHHEFHSEWEHKHEICVCASFGIVCCERLARLESTIPPETTTTAEIHYDDFGAFTEGDHGQPETPPISVEEQAIPEVPHRLDSTESPEAEIIQTP